MPQTQMTPVLKAQKTVNVLLVDDDEVDIMGVKREFKKSDFSNPVVVANNGLEALEKLRDGSVAHPCMVLLDLNMPKMNGLEFLSEVRQDPTLKEMIVFVLTTSKAENDIKKAYAHNIAGYIVKDRTDEGFINTASLLDQYTKLVEFP